MSERIKIEQSSLGFSIWMTGWLFTIGFVDLGFRQGFFAIVIWPWYIGQRLAETFPA